MSATLTQTHLTLLNGMAGRDIQTSLAQQANWGIQHLDLKDNVFGKKVEHLTQDDAEALKTLMQSHGQQLHTMSTSLFHHDIQDGPEAFQQDLVTLKNLLPAAAILQPGQIRLLMASTRRRDEILHSPDYLNSSHPWVIAVYQEAIDLINDAGFAPVIENEAHDNLFSNPAEILGGFNALDRKDKVGLIWDVQNLWGMGTYPSLEVYHTLKPIIHMIHVKGGRCEVPGGPLVWASHLEDASWPILDILQEVIRDQRSPVICLNPSHGTHPDDWRMDSERDIQYLRRSLEAVA